MWSVSNRSMKISLVLFSLFLFLCCTSEDSAEYRHKALEGLQVIKYDELAHQERFNFSDLIDTVYYIFPETNDFSRIGTYDKVQLTDDKIFIVDRTYTKSVFCFDHFGNFIFKVSNAGGGPEEYTELRDFTVNLESNSIDILDFGSRSILKFSIDSGKFIERINIGGFNEFFQAFENMNGKYFVAHDNNCGLFGDCYNLTVRNEDLNFTIGDLPVKKNIEKLKIRNSKIFSRNDSILFYKETLNDTIYNLSSGFLDFYGSIYIDFGSIKINDDIKYSGVFNSLPDIGAYCVENKKTWGLEDFRISSNGIVFFTFATPNLKNVIYDLNSKRGYSFDVLVSDLLTSRFPVTSYKEYFVSYTDSEIIYSAMKPFRESDSTEYRTNFKFQYDTFGSLKRDDNFVLTFYKLKNL